MAVWKLTTSIICISVRPKLNTRGSDSLPTGRSSTLYVSSRSFSSRFSWEPPFTSPDQLSFFQSTLCIPHDFSTTLSNPRLASSTSRVLPRSTLPLFQKNTKFSLLFEICSRNFFFLFFSFICKKRRGIDSIEKIFASKILDFIISDIVFGFWNWMCDSEFCRELACFIDIYI